MPGYGLPSPADESGLLSWSWAQARLESSHTYWLATTRPDGRPHVMPLWGVWADDAFAFSTGIHSVKARNLRANPRCVVTTQDTSEPVVVEGEATLVDDAGHRSRLSEAYAAKYGAPPPDPGEGPLFVVTPRRAFGLISQEEGFAGSATRWIFRE